MSEAGEVGEPCAIAGQPIDASCEYLRATANGLAGLPEALKETDSLTASIYVEAARRNLHYAADLIAIDLHRPATVLDDDEVLDTLLAEWLT